MRGGVSIPAAILLGFVLVAVSACSSKPPLEDYNLAYIAVESARSSQSAKHAPAMWTQAERAYQEGQEFFKKDKFEEAEKAFVRARTFAERAENISRLKKFETGEGVL